MKKVSALCLAIVLCLVAHSALTVRGRAGRQQGKGKFRRVEKSIPNQYVVVLKDDADSPEAADDPGVEAAADQLLRRHGGELKFTYESALKGFAARMPESAAEALSDDPRVDYVIEDAKVSLATTQFNPPSWGLDRIDQRDLPLDYKYNYDFTAGRVHAYVIDSGISPTHPEFGGRAFRSADFVDDRRDGYDCYGHGTHVAGTLGGETFGVAKKVILRSVRVFDCAGNSTAATIIKAVDWVTANHLSPAVANMSLETIAYDPLDTAVRNSIASRVTYVVAAGNSGVDASQVSPARVAEALTVGSTDSTDARSYFSNFGPSLDLFAPGTQITSAWPDRVLPPPDSDCVLLSMTENAWVMRCSGTSQAAPHAAGLAALYLQSNPGAYPATVISAVVGTATVGKVINPGAGSPNRLLCTVH